MSDSGRHVLVTGGAGFVGGHLVERLVARGDRVVVVDNLSTGRRSNLASATEDRIRFIHATVAEAIPRLASDVFDQIYHLAAAVGVRLVIEQPIETIETNVLETGAILRYAGHNATPILITSTSEVYGKGVRTPFGEEDDVVYGPTTLHRWSYACSKAIDEYLALAHHREHGLPVTIARLFNTVGPRQIGAYGMVLPRFVAAALAGAPLEVYGTGDQTRCFCDVRDVVRALTQMLDEPACVGRIFNVGRDEPISIGKLAERVRDVLGSASEIIRIPYDEAFGEGFDDLQDRQPDMTRLRTTIGFCPEYDLDRTIRDLAAALSDASAESMPS